MQILRKEAMIVIDNLNFESIIFFLFKNTITLNTMNPISISESKISWKFEWFSAKICTLPSSMLKRPNSTMKYKVPPKVFLHSSYKNFYLSLICRYLNINGPAKSEMTIMKKIKTDKRFMTFIFGDLVNIVFISESKK
jgi:hypothetical protein